jgi:hypothetical protein
VWTAIGSAGGRKPLVAWVLTPNVPSCQTLTSTGMLLPALQTNLLAAPRLRYVPRVVRCWVRARCCRFGDNTFVGCDRHHLGHGMHSPVAHLLCLFSTGSTGTPQYAMVCKCDDTDAASVSSHLQTTCASEMRHDIVASAVHSADCRSSCASDMAPSCWHQHSCRVRSAASVIAWMSDAASVIAWSWGYLARGQDQHHSRCIDAFRVAGERFSGVHARRLRLLHRRCQGGGAQGDRQGLRVV